MSIGIPTYEHPKVQVATLKGNLKGVVDTVKAIKAAIAEAQADTKRDKTAVIKQLNVNLVNIMNWGKILHEKIRVLEGKA